MAAPDATPEAVLALAEELWADSASPGAAPTDAHHEQARVILASSWLAQRDARVRAEALREAADPILLDHATCSCGLRVLDHDIGGCRTIAADALAEWLRERADRIERGESR